MGCAESPNNPSEKDILRIVVFYHCCLSSRHRPIDIRHAVWLIGQQMRTFQESGLADVADEIHVCVNGDDSDVDVVRCLMPVKVKFHENGSGANSEMPTMARISRWSRDNPDCYVLYWHTKGLSHMDQPNKTWRLQMEKSCIWNWQTCVYDLSQGYDACGCYWLTPEMHHHIIQTPFFGGTFWWAKSNYLAQLPPPPVDTFENRYLAEGWIGTRIPRPRVQSYTFGWPPVV